MNNRGVLVFVASVFMFLFIFSFFIFSFFHSKNVASSSYVDDDSEKVSCSEDSICDDGNSCTLDYCNEMDFCKNTQIVLCYHNDGCCPKGCTEDNDYDCRN